VHRADQVPPDHQEAKPARRGRGHLSTAFVVGLLLTLGAVGLFAAWTVHKQVLVPYETRIYPNVYVLDVDLGGLTPAEASERFTEALGHYDAGLLVLSDDQRTWTVPWSEAGLRLDVDTTVQVAFAVGRADGCLENLLTILNMREGRGST